MELLVHFRPVIRCRSPTGQRRTIYAPERKSCNNCNCFLASFDGCTRLWFGLGLGLKFEALVSVPSRFITVPDHE